MKKTRCTERTLRYYESLNYRYQLIRDKDGGYVALHPELDGCLAQGETPDEAVKNLDAARQLWIAVRLEDGLPIPEPLDDTERA